MNGVGHARLVALTMTGTTMPLATSKNLAWHSHVPWECQACVEYPLVDDRPRALKSNGGKKQKKLGGIGISEAAKSLA